MFEEYGEVDYWHNVESRCHECLEELDDEDEVIYISNNYLVVDGDKEIGGRVYCKTCVRRLAEEIGREYIEKNNYLKDFEEWVRGFSIHCDNEYICPTGIKDVILTKDNIVRYVMEEPDDFMEWYTNEN